MPRALGSYADEVVVDAAPRTVEISLDEERSCTPTIENYFTDSRVVNAIVTTILIFVTFVFFPTLVASITTAIYTAYSFFILATTTILSPLLHGLGIPLMSTSAEHLFSISTIALLILGSSAMFAGMVGYFGSMAMMAPLVIPLKVIIDLFFREEEIKDSFSTVVLQQPLYVTTIAPIQEEFFFRVIIPNIYEYTLRGGGAILSLITDSDFSDPLNWIIEKTKPIVVGYIFGIIHTKNSHPDRLFQAIYCGIASNMLFSPLQNEHGVLANTSAHMTNNAIAYSIMQLRLKLAHAG